MNSAKWLAGEWAVWLTPDPTLATSQLASVAARFPPIPGQPVPDV